MPYSNVISRTDAAALIPEEVSREIIKNVEQQSSTMQLSRRLPNMSRAQRRMPVASALATAYFVSGDTGLKQTTEYNWENKYIDAEEIACIVPIPESVLDDQDYDIWGNVRPSIEEAIGIAVDAAVFHGTNIPASWTTNLGAAGLVALCTAASQTKSLAAAADIYEAILDEGGVISFVEEDGFMVNGHVAHLSLRAKLRGARDANGQPIFKATMQGATSYELDGSPTYFPKNGALSSASALMISGDWSQLVFAIRQDISYKVLDQAVIQDVAGNIVYNLAQQDMVALRAVIRLGFALPNPINRVETVAANRCAFGVLTA